MNTPEVKVGESYYLEFIVREITHYDNEIVVECEDNNGERFSTNPEHLIPISKPEEKREQCECYKYNVIENKFFNQDHAKTCMHYQDIFIEGKPEEKVQKWEYRIEEVGIGSIALNEIAKDGWEIATTCGVHNLGLILKRPITSSPL